MNLADVVSQQQDPEPFGSLEEGMFHGDLWPVPTAEGEADMAEQLPSSSGGASGIDPLNVIVNNLISVCMIIIN